MLGLILGGIAAAKAIGGALKAKGAKDAAKIQSAAADRVAGINRGVYQQQMTGMDPYAALGRTAANTMGRMMTPGIAYTRDQQLADAQRFYNAPPQWSPTPGEGGPAVPRPGGSRTLGEMAEPQMVWMRAPNGSQRQVPANQVDMFQQRGAVRI